MCTTSNAVLMVKNSPANARNKRHGLEREMVTHSSILAWRIPWTGETGGLQSIASLDRVRHDRARTFINRKIHIRYKQQINQSTSEKLFCFVLFCFSVCFFPDCTDKTHLFCKCRKQHSITDFRYKNLLKHNYENRSLTKGTHIELE